MFPRPIPTTVCEPSTLTGTPLYVALSYAWGDPNDPAGILLDGTTRSITVSLFVALRQLRDLLRYPSRAPEVFNNDSILFWIDTLYIDQSNVED